VCFIFGFDENRSEIVTRRQYKNAGAEKYFTPGPAAPSSGAMELGRIDIAPAKE